jgi:hypothetical protein
MLEHAAPARTITLVADVGNDLAYHPRVARVVEWVTSTLDRLVQRESRIGLYNIPSASLGRVGALRLALLRSALVSSCGLGRSERLRRARALRTALADLAESREIPAFSGETGWYGLDLIRLRRRSAGPIWQRMLGAHAAPAGDVGWAALSRDDARISRRAPAAYRSLDGAREAARPARALLTDGTTIAHF